MYVPYCRVLYSSGDRPNLQPFLFCLRISLPTGPGPGPGPGLRWALFLRARVWRTGCGWRNIKPPVLSVTSYVPTMFDIHNMVYSTSKYLLTSTYILPRVLYFHPHRAPRADVSASKITVRQGASIPYPRHIYLYPPLCISTGTYRHSYSYSYSYSYSTLLYILLYTCCWPRRHVYYRLCKYPSIHPSIHPSRVSIYVSIYLSIWCCVGILSNTQPQLPALPQS